MQNVVADLAVESEAATALAIRLAAAVDNLADPHEAALRRIALPLAKYWVCKRTPMMVAEALECLGGNGYVEESGMPLLFRESPLNSIWEGSGNVNALDVLRALSREPEALNAWITEVGRARGEDPRLDRAIESVLETLADTSALEVGARRLAGPMAACLQGALLVQHAPAAVADAFCATRLGQEYGGTLGTLPRGIDLAVHRRPHHPRHSADAPPPPHLNRQVRRAGRPAQAARRAPQVQLCLSSCDGGRRFEALPHVVGVEHHVLPGEPEHAPARAAPAWCSGGSRAAGRRACCARVRLGLHDPATLAVDQVGAATPFLVGDHHLRLQVAARVRRARSLAAADSNGLAARWVASRATRRACGAPGPLIGVGELDQPGLGDVAVPQRRVGDRQRLVERQRLSCSPPVSAPAMSRDRPPSSGGRSDQCSVDAVRLVRQQVPLPAHRHVRPLGNRLHLPAPVKGCTAM